MHWSGVMAVSFVRGHPRDAGWVKGHVRGPIRAEEGQLPLVDSLPLPRSPEPDEELGGEPFSSARKSAITRS
jgi:hypothetical protein